MNSPTKRAFNVSQNKDSNASSELMQKYLKYNQEQRQVIQVSEYDGFIAQAKDTVLSSRPQSQINNQQIPQQYQQQYHQQQQRQQIQSSSSTSLPFEVSHFSSWGSSYTKDLQLQHFIFSKQIQPRVLQVCSGDNHVILLDESNRVYSKGSNTYGQLGQVGISFLDQFAKGEVFSWGSNIKGQLGHGMYQNLFTPTILESFKSSSETTKNNKSGMRSQSTEKNYNQQNMRRSESLEQVLSELDQVAADNNIDITKSGSQNQKSVQAQPLLEQDESVAQISCGALHSLVLTSHGRVFATGYGESYALGHGNEETTSVFTEVKCFSSPPKQNRSQSRIQELSSSILGSDEYVEQIQCGLVHSVCLTNKRIFAWGIVSEDPTTIFQFPEEIMIEDVNYQKDNYSLKIIDIQCGQSLSLFLTKGGNVYVFGKLPGEVQSQQRSQNNRIARKITAFSQISKISLNRSHCLAYSKEQKKVYGWGNNEAGQLQLNSTITQIAVPLDIANMHQDSQITLLASGPTSSYIISDFPFQVNQLTIPQPKEKLEKTQRQSSLGSSSPTKRQQNNEVELMRADFEKKKQSLVQKYNELQRQTEQMTNDNYNLIQEEENNMNLIKQLKSQLNLSEKELNHYKKQSETVKSDQNVKFKIQNSEKFKHVKSRTFAPNLEIPYTDLEIIRKITEGGYGIIFKAKWREIIVAVKKFKLDYSNQQQIAEFVNECNAMEALRHPNIVLFLGACTEINNFCIIMEYCQRGSLWSILQNPQVDLKWELRRKIALDIAKGVYFLHSAKPPILHRDLKSLNVLVDDNFRCKLTDFGWTRVKPLDNYMTNKIGTYQWMAPEVVNGFYYTEKADVFSYSIILWEIASREPPYRGIKGDEVAQDVLSKNLRPVVPQNTPRFFRSLIESCWEADPEKRPTFKEIVRALEVMIVE